MSRGSLSRDPQPGISNGRGQRQLTGSPLACPRREKRSGIGESVAMGNTKGQDGGEEYPPPGKY